MALRISWSDFPRLRDNDVFAYREAAGTPGELRITLSTGPRVTWWKAVKVVQRSTGTLVRRVAMQDSDHGPRSLVVSASEAAGVKIVLAKAKLFGVHTDMYDLYEVGEKLGRQIELVWEADSPDNVFGAIGSFINDVVSGGVAAVQTVVGAVVTAVVTVVSAVTNAIGWLVGLVLAIPIIGRGIALVVNAVGAFIGWVVHGFAEIVTTAAGAVGLPRPEKILRLVVVVQRDELNNPVATRAQVEPQIDFLQKLLQERANIRLVPDRPFTFTSPFNSEPAPPRDFIVELDRPSSRTTLDVRCGVSGFADDFGYAGAGFQVLMNNLYWGNTGRLTGIGAPIVVFAVRRFTGPANTAGCSFGPLHHYVTADFNSQYSLLAHEVVHALSLGHHDTDPSNLMFSTSPSPTPLGDLSKWLNNEQVFVMRASPKVTFV